MPLMPDYVLPFSVVKLVLANVTALVAVWAALGRGHWFFRVLVMVVWLDMWMLVPAYEITIALLVESLVITLPLMGVRRWRTRELGRPLVQFSVRDLLLVTVLVAITAAAAVSARATIVTPDVVAMSRELLPRLALDGAIAGVAVLVAAWAALGRSRLAVRIAVFLPVVIVAVPSSYQFWLAPSPGTPPGPYEAGIKGYMLAGVTALGLLVLPAVVFWAAATMRRSAARPADGEFCVRRLLARAVPGAFVALVALGLVTPSLGLFYALVTPPTMPEEPLPVPNGYDTLVRVATQFQMVAVPEDGEDLPPAERAGPDAFRAFRKKYDALASEARAALDTPCRVPVTYETGVINSSNGQGLRQLARTLDAGGRAAALDGDYAAAVGYHLDTIRLGQATGRGGLLVDWLVGVAIEGVGLDGLHRERKALPEAVRHETVRRLTELRRTREPLEPCERREDVWEARAYGWNGRLIQVVDKWNGEEAVMHAMFESCGRRSDARFQILITELAIEAYRQQHGAWPATLDALVPEELEQVPQDPCGAGPLVYRLTDDGYQLYSVGSNGVDDGRKSYVNNDPVGDDVWFW